MIINFVFNTFPSPSETFLFNLAAGLSGKGHKVTMILMSKSNNMEHYKDRMHEWKGEIVTSPVVNKWTFLTFLIKNFIEVIVFAKKQRLTKADKIASSYTKWKLVTSNKPNIIHFAYTGLAIEFSEVIDLISAESKVFVSARGSAEIVKPITDKARVSALKRLWQQVDKVHCVSLNMLEKLETLELKRNMAFVNYPSIDVTKFSFRKKNEDINFDPTFKIKILSTGRLYYQKGYIFALSAIKSLVSKGFDIEYHILGEGPDRELLEFYIADNKLDDNVLLCGKVSSEEVSNKLSESHIFLLPSIYEGVSNAVLEAMAVGTPVITTDAGGMAEVIQDGTNGFLVARYNAVALEEAILKIIHDYPSAIERSVRARKTVEEKFNLEFQLQIFEQEYKNAINNYSL